MDLGANCSTPPCLNQFCWDLIKTWCVILAFQQPTQTQRHSAQALVVLLCVILTSLTPCIFNS